KSSSYGGSENSWIDSTDIHFRNSHCGTAWDSYWGKNLSSIPFHDGSVTPGEARRAWGDYDAEWIASKCCSLLRDDSRAYWYTTFDGLHLMLGFKTSSYGATNFGRKWAERMKKTTILWWTWDGQTVTQAWFNTTDETQPSGTTARVLAEVYNNYNDHLWGQGYVSSDPTYNGWYWYWDHVAGSPPYLTVNSLDTMNVYRVVPRNVDEQYVQSIGRAFKLTGQVVSLCDSSLAMADASDPANPKVLKVYKGSGQFYFQNQGKLFAANPDAGQFDPRLAEGVATSFLEEYGLLPQDAKDSSVEFDTLTEESEHGEVRQQLFQNTNVVYARQLPADAAGGQMVSVAGAGARLKVYLYDDGQHGEVIGAMGNWRNVEVTGSIQVNDFDRTWSFFDKYKEALSPAKAQVAYNKAVPIPEEATQGYYEHPGFAEQQELIPCWIIPVEYYQDDILVLKADTFVPAAESYFPPIVDILKPAEFETFNEGDMVAFDCEVVEEGFGTPPYNYMWESDVDGMLSTQKSFQTDQLSVNCPDTSCECRPLPHTISVTVTDAKGSESEDFVVITIKGECDECSSCADLDNNTIVDLRDLAHWADRYLTQTGHTGPR
ncbi:MAG: hypothetical protein AMJ75_05010, partial [Phycisphaerae bacterium SM1_79]